MSESSGLRVQRVKAATAIEIVKQLAFRGGYECRVDTVTHPDTFIVHMTHAGDLVTLGITMLASGAELRVCAATSSPAWVIVAFGGTE